MPTTRQITDIVEKVRNRLGDGEQGDDQVLLVPALQD